MIRLLMPVLLLTTAACQYARPETAGPPPQPTACGAEKVQHYVGKKRSTAISGSVAALSDAKSIRWIEPGMAVTMDFREDRLNVKLDEKGVILSFTCG